MSQEFNYPTLAANSRLYVATRGRFIRVLNVTGADFVTIEFPNQAGLKSPFSLPLYAGTWLKLPDDQYFSEFFIVVGAAPVSDVKITVVDGIFGDDRLALTGGSLNTNALGGTLSEVADGAAPVLVGAGLSVQVAAANPSRQNIIVRNTGAAAVYIRSDATAAASAFEVGAGQSVFAEIVSAVFVYNPSGAAINIQVSEIA
jgi:hypothetical protein